MKKILFLVIISLMLFSCRREKPCTEEFRMLTVTIYNTDNSLFLPDAYYFVWSAYGDTLFSHLNNPYNEPLIEGIIIFTDNEMKYTNNEGGEIFKFTAYQDTLEVINEDYLIRHDNCHFELVAGKTIIVL